MNKEKREGLRGCAVRAASEGILGWGRVKDMQKSVMSSPIRVFAVPQDKLSFLTFPYKPQSQGRSIRRE